MNPVVWLNRHKKTCNVILWGFFIFVLLSIIISYYTVDLINPFHFLMTQLGRASIVSFLLCYTISVLARSLTRLAVMLSWNIGKRLSDWSFLYYQRRMLGLCSIYFALCHMLVYLYFELDFQWSEFYFDVSNRYFIGVGMLGMIVGTVLALSSFTYIRRKLKRNWQRLHLLTHLLALLFVTHIILAVKTIQTEQLIYLSSIVLLCGERIYTVARKQFFKHQSSRRTRRKHQKLK